MALDVQLSDKWALCYYSSMELDIIITQVWTEQNGMAQYLTQAFNIAYTNYSCKYYLSMQCDQTIHVKLPKYAM